MFKYTIEGELPDLNKYINAERSNRYIAAKIKKEATELVAWQLKGREKITVAADYHFHWVVKDRRKDPDNIYFAGKFVLDGMQAAGILPQDSMKYVKSILHTHSVGKPKVVLTVSF